MKTKKLNTFCGSKFDDVAKEAKDTSLRLNCYIEFDFNGVNCIVNQTTNLKWLFRDYMNAHTMDWKTVGPDCIRSYPQDVYDELERRTKIAEVKAAKRAEEYMKEQQRQKEALETKIKGIEIELSDEDGWKKSREANADAYGKGALDYAENWAKLMQYEIANGKSVAECADITSHEADYDGITGFMYSCAKSILVQTWKYGNELHKVK